MLSRVPVRIRLAAGFAAGLALVLVLAGVFVYTYVADSLDHALEDNLTARATDARKFAGGPGLEPFASEAGEYESDSEEAFTQVLRGDGSVVFSTLPSQPPILSSDQIAEASRDDITLDRVEVDGVDDEVRVLAEPLDEPQGTLIVVVGASMEAKDETLADLRQAFVVGGPMALFLASIIGYLLGARALVPVERMRQRARQITFDHPGERLPAPAANDELRRLATTLNEMLDRIEAALQRERVFVSDASHELRTPLATLKAELELARRTGSSKTELIAAVESAAEEVDHLILLSENLLVIDRADQGKLSLRLEELDVIEFLEKVRDRFEHSTASAGRSIQVEGTVAGTYRFDRVRLEQALVNLVDNALKHGAGEVRIGALEDDRELVLYVRDNGSGFDPEFRDQAFERFSQAHSGRSDLGTGLGLAIVRAITVAHGGRVEIKEGQGGADVRMVFDIRL